MDKIMQIYKEILLADLSREEKFQRIQSLIKIVITKLFTFKLNIYDGVFRIMDNLPPSPLTEMANMTVKLQQENQIQKFQRGFDRYFNLRIQAILIKIQVTGPELHLMIRNEWDNKTVAEKEQFMDQHNIN